MARMAGVEPTLAESKSAFLPLEDIRISGTAGRCRYAEFNASLKRWKSVKTQGFVVTTISSSFTLNRSARITRLSSVGKVSPLCHLKTVCRFMQSASCTCRTVRPLSFRRFAIFLPVAAAFIIGMLFIVVHPFKRKPPDLLILQIRRSIIPIKSGLFSPSVCSSHVENLHHTGIQWSFYHIHDVSKPS